MEKDVVVVTLGAAAGIAGLQLVFLGLVINALQNYPGDTPDQVLRKYKAGSIAILSSFFLSLASVTLSLIWLIASGPDALYGWTVGVFVVQLISALAIAIYVTVNLVFS